MPEQGHTPGGSCLIHNLQCRSCSPHFATSSSLQGDHFPCLLLPPIASFFLGVGQPSDIFTFLFISKYRKTIIFLKSRGKKRVWKTLVGTVCSEVACAQLVPYGAPWLFSGPIVIGHVTILGTNSQASVPFPPNT